jgi:hypothetical protein
VRPPTRPTRVAKDVTSPTANASAWIRDSRAWWACTSNNVQVDDIEGLSVSIGVDLDLAGVIAFIDVDDAKVLAPSPPFLLPET